MRLIRASDSCTRAVRVSGIIGQAGARFVHAAAGDLEIVRSSSMPGSPRWRMRQGGAAAHEGVGMVLASGNCSIDHPSRG